MTNLVSNGGAPKVTVHNAAIQAVLDAKNRSLPPELGLADLLAWLTVQLDASDHDIRAQMEALTNSKDQNAALATLKSQIDAARGKAGDPKVIPDELTPDALQTANWYQKLADGDPVKQAIDDFVQHKVGLDTSKGFVASDDDLKALSDTLSDRINANTSSNEMDMIKLQSAISARGQAIQMISNMVSAMHETAKGVVGNIRA